MKQQVARFSPHQNGKVFAILMAVSSLIFFVPFFLIFAFAVPPEQRPPMFALVLMPVFYLVAGYIMVALGCLFYNFMFRYIGGIEFEPRASDASQETPPK